MSTDDELTLIETVCLIVWGVMMLGGFVWVALMGLGVG